MGKSLEPMTTNPRVRRALELARWMDNRYLDPIIGLLLPEVGDWIGTVIGLYPIFVAYREGVAPKVIARMLVNLGLDLLAGSVPVIGDIVDFFWKANRRNAEILEAVVDNRHAVVRSEGGGWLWVALALGFLFSSLAFSVWLISHVLLWMGTVVQTLW